VSKVKSRAASRYLQAFKTPVGLISTLSIVALTSLAFLAPVIFPNGYDQQSANSLLGPSLKNPLGTDDLGRDIFTRVVYGLRSDLTLVYIAVPISLVIGTFLGLIGMISNFLGNLSMRLMDFIIGFPALILAISITVVLGTGFTALLVSIIILGTPGVARLARSTMLEQEQREYVIAARVLGISKWKILFRHILPNIMDPLIAQGAILVVVAIFIESGMSIIGLGLQPPAPSLGVLLNNSMRFIIEYPTFVIGPVVALVSLTLAFGKLADALNATVVRK
jgi:peptide/nickel transport system permease protein